MPTCDKYDINMAIHPDDPAWSVFGLPRIIINKQNILRMMKMVDNPHNGVTFVPVPTAPTWKMICRI